MADTGFSESAEKAVDAVADGVAEAREKFSRISDDMQNRYKKVSNDVRRGAERAGKEIRRGADAARETYRDAADNVREGYNKVRTQTVHLSREVGEYVRDNPGKSVLIAAGIGFLLGLIVRGRDEDND